MEKECVDGCGGFWLECSIQVLQQNKVHPVIFAEAMRELLVKACGKYRNIMIVGPANCGKTFLLRPLQTLFDTFSNPFNDKYAWLGAETAEMIFLNDFRFSSEMIAWRELLLLLEVGNQFTCQLQKNIIPLTVDVSHTVLHLCCMLSQL